MCLRSPFFSDSHHRVFCRFRQWVLLSASLMLVACSGQSLFEPPQVAGIISVPDSNIAKSGIAMLEKGGNAADAQPEKRRSHAKLQRDRHAKRGSA